MVEVQTMNSFRKELWFNTPARVAFVNITRQVEECVRESGVKECPVLANAMHITASVFINDDESGLHHDYSTWPEKLAPHERFFSSLKNELVHHTSFKTRNEARTALFKYIVIFYDRQRRHQTLDCLSPGEYDRKVGVY